MLSLFGLELEVDEGLDFARLHLNDNEDDDDDKQSLNHKG